jgi:hypothetical protein
MISKTSSPTPNNTSPSEQLKSRRLYVEFRVYFQPNTNQELLKEMAEAAQERVFEMFNGIDDDTSGPLPSPHDVTYEIVVDLDWRKEEKGDN